VRLTLVDYFEQMPQAGKWALAPNGTFQDVVRDLTVVVEDGLLPNPIER
jgi:hypothetical protein